MSNDVYIRSRTSARYLTAGGSWTASRKGSRNFLTVTLARDWCVQEALMNIEIVVVRENLICMRVPIGQMV
jgi:hypothetical protein